MKSKNRALMVIGSILMAISVIMLLYPLFFRFLISFKDYQPFIGFLKSEFVGLRNFVRFLKSDYFLQIARNSTVTALIGTVFGALYVFFSTLATGSISRTVPKSIVAAFFSLPLAIPSTILAGLVAHRIDGEALSWLILSVGGILPFAALFSLGGLFVNKSPTRAAIRLSTVFVAVKFVMFFTDNFAFLNTVSTPYTYSFTETFVLTGYRSALLQGDFSYGAAIDTLRGVFALIPVALGCLVLIIYMKDRDEKRGSNMSVGETSSFKVVATIMSLVPVFLAAFVLTRASGDAFYIREYLLSYVNSVVISFFAAIIGAVFVFFMANAVRDLRTVGVVIICVLCVASENIIGQFFATYLFHGLDTHAGVILMDLRYVPVLTLVFAIFIRIKDTPAARTAVLPLMLAAMFSFSWGDFTSSLVLLNDVSKYPMILRAREVFIQGLNGVVNLSVYAAAPMVLLVVCVVASAWIMKNREE